MNKPEQDTVQMLQKLGTFEKYRCIYADPPWSKNQKGKLGAISHYDLMTLEQIQRIPIRALSHEDAMAWLWVPQGLIPEGLEVLKSWGYRYIDEMIWDKYYLGLGRYLRHTHETMLLGIRGKPELKFRAQPSLVRAPRQDHSHKPEEFFPIIERISHPPYLELFARRRPTSACPEQWDVWGNEIASDLYIPGYPVPQYSAKAVLPEEAR